MHTGLYPEFPYNYVFFSHDKVILHSRPGISFCCLEQNLKRNKNKKKWILYCNFNWRGVISLPYIPMETFSSVS